MFSAVTLNNIDEIVILNRIQLPVIKAHLP